MGLFDDIMQRLFGGAQTSSSSATGPVDMTPGPFRDLQNPLAGLFQSFLGGAGNNMLSNLGQQYGGPLFAPMTDAEGATLARLGMMPTFGKAGSYFDDAVAGKYLGPNQYMSDYIKAAQHETQMALEQTLGRTLPGRFAMAGHLTNPYQTSKPSNSSSAFDRAAALAYGEGAHALGKIATDITYQGYESERNRQQAAANSRVQLGQAEVDSTIKTLQAQALPRLIQELGIERGMKTFQDSMGQVLDVLKLIGGITQPTVATAGSSTSSGTQNKGIFDAITIGFPK